MKSFCLLINLMIVAVLSLTCDAAETKTETIPICYVGHVAKVTAKMAWRVGCYEYPGTPDYKSFLSDTNDPESIVARFLNVALGLKPTPADVVAYFDPAEDQNIIKQLLGEVKSLPSAVKGLRFLSRYDVGEFALIYVLVDVDGPEPVLPSYYQLRRSKLGWVIVPRAHPLENSSCLLSEIDMDYRFNKRHGLRAKEYEYSVQLLGFKGELTGVNHPSALQFDGKYYNVKLGKDAQPEDALAGFVNHVWLTAKEGTSKNWLELFSAEEAELREGDLKGSVKRQHEYFAAKNAKLVFAIDFGPQAVAFLKDDDSPDANLQPLLLWKGNEKDYKLTDTSAPVTNEEPVELSFPGNLPRFFELKEFQNYLKLILTQRDQAQEKTMSK